MIVWSVESGQVAAALPGQTGPVTGLDWSGDGQYLASCSEDLLLVWCVDGEAGPEDSPLSLGPPHSTRWRDGQPITAAPDDRNRVAVLQARAVVATTGEEESPVTCLELSPDCSRVVFGTAAGLVRQVNTRGGPARLLGRHQGAVTAVAAGGAVTLSGGLDRAVWMYREGREAVELRPGHEEAVREVRLAGSRAVSCCLGGRILVWGLAGQLVARVNAGATPHATCLDLGERAWTGGLVAAVAGVAGGVRVVDLEAGTCIARPGPQHCPVRVARFSPVS